MKRFFTIFFVLWAVSGMAQTSVQTDQNTGPLDLASPSISVGPNVPAGFFFGDEFPASTTQITWEGTNNMLLSRLPRETKGFRIEAFGGDLLFGGADISTGTSPFVGIKIASGTAMIWEGRIPAGRIGPFRILAFGTATLSATIMAW